MPSDQDLKHPMIPPGQLLGGETGAPREGRVTQGEEAKAPSGKKDPEPGGDRSMPKKKGGKGIHPQGNPEENRPGIGTGNPLIPEKGEAPPLVKMPQGGAG
jgi:hypothetical protein